MFGIKFIFHSNLRRILTDYGFQGHPLRKDFPLIGYVDIYYNDSIQNISYGYIELSQMMRLYSFATP
jgi:NADH:ubiquinone oxidoreductase subunit C